jgi:hypothetical protein
MPAERVGTRPLREILRLTFAANCTSPVLPCAVLFSAVGSADFTTSAWTFASNRFTGGRGGGYFCGGAA